MAKGEDLLRCCLQRGGHNTLLGHFVFDLNLTHFGDVKVHLQGKKEGKKLKVN